MQRYRKERIRKSFGKRLQTLSMRPQDKQPKRMLDLFQARSRSVRRVLAKMQGREASAKHEAGA